MQCKTSPLKKLSGLWSKPTLWAPWRGAQDRRAGAASASDRPHSTARRRRRQIGLHEEQLRAGSARLIELALTSESVSGLDCCCCCCGRWRCYGDDLWRVSMHRLPYIARHHPRALSVDRYRSTGSRASRSFAVFQHWLHGFPDCLPILLGIFVFTQLYFTSKCDSKKTE